MSTIIPLPNNKIIGYSELKRARELQDEAIKLHLPAPPVVWLEAKVTNNGNVRKHLQSKSNSYVRNAYNMLASNLIMPPDDSFSTTEFGDGIMSVKQRNGNILATAGRGMGIYYSLSPQLVLGLDNTPDTLDDFDVLDEYQQMITTRTGQFDFSSRKYIVNIIGTHINNSAAVDIGEVACVVSIARPGFSGNAFAIILRDVFSPKINVKTGETLTLNYQLEVAFP